MKNKLLLLAAMLLCLFCAPRAGAQITLDHTYTFTAGVTRLYMVNLEISGPKYVVKSDDSGNRYLKFYNLNHSLWKVVNCNPFKTTVQNVNGRRVFTYGAYYISQSLFNCDTNIEFLYTNFAASPDQAFVGVYNELGTAVFSSDSSGTNVNSSLEWSNAQIRPIYNTPGGTKMIIYKYFYTAGGWGSVANIYSLPCNLSTGVASRAQETGDFNVVPNPHYYESTINYTLPAGINEAQILVTDITGKELKRYTVDRSFHSLLIAHDDLPAGTYLYSMIGGGAILSAKKVIKLN